ALLKWAQKNKRSISWKHDKEADKTGDIHIVTLVLDEEDYVTDKNRSRKRAEELCCEKACRQLELS
ncbi:MAG: hypothetical protein IT244_08080, partial [Bacteroidia bacterium]|nr:hypothetical protein [Bacteroidia bacterium]